MYLVFTTTKNPKQLAEKLVKNNYAACVSYYPITSIYYWKGDMVEDQEYMLIIKTGRLRRTINKLKEIHDYELPEIIYYKARASRSYQDWVRANS